MWAGPDQEATRLEELWRGDFGKEYIERNRNSAEGRGAFWNELLSELPIRSALEIGCNIGGNLGWITQRIPARDVCAVDVNEEALREVRRTLPGVNAVWSPARRLPFRDAFFDLTFTTGVLIHQPPETLPEVMGELVRCSRRYVLCGEYYAKTLTEVPYRGQARALFKQDYGALYERLFPNLRRIREGFLPLSKGGWDDVTYWVFEKTDSPDA